MVKQVNSPQQVFDRVGPIAWRESPNVNSCDASRVHLLLEYMRRAALWARDTGTPAPGLWPIYGIAGTACLSFTVEVDSNSESRSGFKATAPGSRA